MAGSCAFARQKSWQLWASLFLTSVLSPECLWEEEQLDGKMFQETFLL